MSLFAVQVRYGQELEAKKMLEVVLRRYQFDQVTGIYALETFTEIVQKDQNPREISEFLNNDDVSNYLKAKRIREKIVNLRAACMKMSNETCKATKELYHNYQEEIHRQTCLLKEICNLKRIHSVLKGYLLIEIKEALLELPARLHQIIQLVPNIKSLVSPYSIPEEEVNQFLSHSDFTPTIEIIVPDQAEEEHLSLPVEEISTQEAEKEGSKCRENLKQPDRENKIKNLLQKCRVFQRRNQKVLALPLTVFQLLEQSGKDFQVLVRHAVLAGSVQSQQLEAKG